MKGGSGGHFATGNSADLAVLLPLRASSACHFPGRSPFTIGSLPPLRVRLYTPGWSLDNLIISYLQELCDFNVRIS